MSNFKTSSQKLNWIFSSAEELAIIRAQKSKKVALKIRRAIDAWNRAQEDLKMQKLPYNYVHLKDNKVGKTSILTVEEEIRYLNTLIMTTLAI